MNDTRNDERRSLLRFPLTVRADVRYEGLDWTGFTVDLSVAGAFVRPDDLHGDPLMTVVQPGDGVELMLDLGSGEPLAIAAEVVHRGPGGVGLRFRQRQPGIFDRARA